MATKDQVIEQIRFGLFQLSERNAQHLFEDLCRHLTGKRICSNIIPATGPVQSGGDQGRDFETFHTYLKNSPIAENSFIGLASDKPITFACSLKEEGIPGKIRSDVNTIMAGGVKVERIYFFSSRKVETSKRHKLIDWAQNTHSVPLEIIDGRGLAELLAEPDVFWIADRYLGIPSEIYPRPIDEDDWYRELFGEYKERETISLTFEEFTEIKIAGRHIYKTSDLKHDLPFWIEKLQNFISDKTFLRIKREAMYETFVLSFIGMGVATGYESMVQEYFSSLEHTADIYELEDAVCLLSLAKTATWSHQLMLLEEEFSLWQESVESIINARLNEAKDSNIRCGLLAIKAEASILIPRNMLDFQGNFDTAINLFQQLLSEIPQAPFYPLERLSSKLTKYIEKFLDMDMPVNIDSFEELATKADELFAARSSSFKIADKLGDRAILYLNKGQIITALQLLHRAKEAYFADKAEGTLLMLLFIADSYQRLKMNLAGKYYALIAFHLTMSHGTFELSKYMSQAICKAASVDYKNGAWMSFLDLIGPALLLGSYTLKDYIEKHPQVDEILYHLTVIKYIMERLAPNLHHVIDFQINKWHFLREYIDELFIIAKTNFDTMTSEELWQSFEEQLDYVPFNDIGDTRSIKWNACGVTWELRFRNNYSITPIAEQFGAILQILLVELAPVELYLMKESVTIEVVLAHDQKPSCTPKASEKGKVWEVRLPSLRSTDKATVAEFQSHFPVFAVAIIHDLSLLPSKQFTDIITESYKNGLRSKAMFLLPYVALYDKYVGEEKFNISRRNEFSNPFQSKPFTVTCSENLAWKDGIAPLYDQAKNRERISNRYKNSLELVEITLKQLNKCADFQRTVERLKNKGWLDWHILLAVMNTALSHKAKMNTSISASVQDFQQEFVRISKLPEKDNYIPLPPQIFDKEALEQSFMSGMLVLLPSYGLEYHGTNLLNVKAIEELLTQRFKLFTDDVEHEEIFQVS